MTPHRVINIALACLGAATFGALLSTSYLLDGSSDLDATTRTAQSLQDAQRTAQHQARFERAARHLCGGGPSAYELLDDHTIMCLTPTGGKTITSKVAL